MPVAASITDLIVTEKGKTSEVLEIKSECDSFDRLASQLPDYYKVFRKVSLVTGEKLFKKAKERFGDTQLGLYVIDRNGALFKEREPVERYDLLDKREIFRSLRLHHFKATSGNEKHKVKIPLQTVMPDVPELR